MKERRRKVTRERGENSRGIQRERERKSEIGSGGGARFAGSWAKERDLIKEQSGALCDGDRCTRNLRLREMPR